MTSPTCFVEIAEQTGFDVAGDVRRRAGSSGLHAEARPARRRGAAPLRSACYHRAANRRAACDRAAERAARHRRAGHAMIGILIIAHDTPRRQPGAGGHARARHAAAAVRGARRSPPPTIRCMLLPHARELVARLDTGDGVLIVLRHLRRHAVQPRLQAAACRAGSKGVAGVNLPMLVRAFTYRTRGMDDDDQEGGVRRLRRRAAHRAWIRSMQQREVEIVNKLGLHARASAKLTQLAGEVPVRRLRCRATAAGSTPRASWA